MAKIMALEGNQVTAMMMETNQKKVELENFLKVCKGSPKLLNHLCDIVVICGSRMDSESCAPVPKRIQYDAATECVKRIVEGCEVNGEDGNFSNGCFGSRWMDLDKWAKKNGIDYCRCAFFSKKFHEGVWKSDKQYMIQIQVEKSK